MFESIVDRKIKVALVGCGRIASKHFEAFQNFSTDMELVAVCDNDPNVLAKAEDSQKVRAFSSLPQLLSNSDADLIVLTTPSGLHPSQAIQCFRAGRHVVSEKPMATRLADGLEMVKVADETNRHLFVVKQNRHNQTLLNLKAAIDQGRFGKLQMVSVNVFWTRPQEYYDQAPWRGTWDMDGGAFMNQASHYVDLLDWMVGPVESVFSYNATLGRDIEADDTGVACIKWRSGALGSINVTMLTYPENYEGSITILGEKGTVRIGGVAVNKIEKWTFADNKESDLNIKNSNYETASVYGFGHAAYYRNVFQSLRGLETPMTCGRQGLRSLELLSAFYKSAREGKSVSLPLNT